MAHIDHDQFIKAGEALHAILQDARNGNFYLGDHSGVGVLSDLMKILFAKDPSDQPIVHANAIGFVRSGGAGKFDFVQAGHPENDLELLALGWQPVYLRVVKS